MDNLPNGDNPFFQAWLTPFAAPPFDRIKAEHFMPAFEYGISQHKAEIAAIVANPDPASFENTFLPLEKSGKFLSRVQSAFDCIAATVATDEIDKLGTALSPILSRYGSDFYQNEGLFRRVSAVYEARDALSTQARRVVEKYYRGFKASGAHLPVESREEIKDISARLSALATQFGQNVKADAKAFALPLDTEDDRRGLSAAYLSVAANAAAERGLKGTFIATLGVSATDSFLTESSRRDLREIVYKAGKARGANNNANNNAKIIEEIAQLRARLAEISGFKTFAHFKLENTMAGTPEAIDKLHMDVWIPARQALMRDKNLVEDAARADGMNEPLKPWDWLYYANKVRERDCAIDETKASEYLSLNQCIEAMFYAANRLFGLAFTERKDIPVYHPDVRVWEVTGKNGQHVALFYGDYFAREGKRDGAFMSEIREQNRLAAENNTPVIYNVCNFGKPAEGGPALLRLREYAGTLFHEFGHALHGMLSNTDYPSLSGTKVLRDFVEFPSQLFEMFALDDALLTRFARHYQTGEVMPQEMRDKIRAAQTFNMGFKTAEYIGSSVLDIEWHSLRPGEVKTVAEIEQAVARRLDMPDIVEPRHKSTHFGHIVRGYAAGYSSYIWADCLVADAHEKLSETGDIFAPENGQRLGVVYPAGDSEHPAILVRNLLGCDPDTGAILRQRGFAPPLPQRSAPVEIAVVSSKPAAGAPSI